MTARGTPTPTECEEFEDAYALAWDFWLELHTSRVSKKRFHSTASYLDSLPGVSEYFRRLCRFDVVCQDGAWVLRPAS